jgi:hypothetical protein
MIPLWKGKNSIYFGVIRSKVMVTVPNDPKIKRFLPLLPGNHVAKCGKDPIYRTKVIVRKHVWTPVARHTQSHNTARLEKGVYKIGMVPVILDLYQAWPHDSPVEGKERYLFWGY